ncbi:MAG: hypothetical protein II949_13545 [Prevotella sp.]|nr:hypothetical protein [Prevotella sp.]
MKNLKIMNMLLGGLLVLGSLASCGGSDDNDDPTPTPQPDVLKATSATAEYVVNLNQGLLDAATVTIYYIDGNGQQAQETATTTTWTKTVSFAALPTQAGFSVQPQLKGAPSQEAYTIEADGKMTVTVLDQKGATFGNPYVGNKLEAKGQLGPDFLGQFLTRISTRLLEAKAISADGSITDTAITWGGNADNDDPNRDTEVSTDGATGTTRASM